ncbi:MAG TPA: ABC transporter permease [Bacteroidales bacterium]|jgi:putative ABC transport system permease protein|nr:ABC transporter permease [Bacteroidales bacterium]
MITNYLKIAWRNFVKSKVFSFINILGLTIGITVCMMIFLFIMNEFSFDRFHKNEKNIYRVMFGKEGPNNSGPWLSGPYATALLNDYPEQILKAVRIIPSNGLVAFGEKSFNEKKLYIADPDFFTMFSFPLIQGDPATALKDPNNVVLTESTARKYFGDEDPMGKVIEVDKEMQLTVTGVARDVPVNSHLDFDIVMSLTVYYNADFFKVWMDNNNFTYVQLNERVNKSELEKSFPDFIIKYLGKDWVRMNSGYTLYLIPLADVYFMPSIGFDRVKHGDRKVVYIFISIAIFILLIACINFVNLSTIRAISRSSEVGLRKAMGAKRRQLIFQFIGESLLLAFISCTLSVFLLQLLMPLYDNLLGYTLKVSWNVPFIYLFPASVIIVVGILAGSYPAFFLASFSPVKALKGKIIMSRSSIIFRQALVAVQFTISVLLIIGTIVIMSQMKYVKEKELGYDKEHSIVVRIDNGDIYNKMNSFADELRSKASVREVSLMSGEPGGFFDQFPFEVEGQTGPWKSRSEFADFNFVKILGLKIIAGRDFSPEFRTDSASAVLINRTAAASLNLTPEQALGKWLKNPLRDKARRTIIGVVEDFHFLSLKEKMDALVISPAKDRRVAVIKLNPGDLKKNIAEVKEVYSRMAPVYPFEYTFLDEKFDVLYKTDINQQKILSIFSGLAILVACLGLFGLASFTVTRRNKEISIRKVLGSKVKNIVLLLSKDLLKPVLIATFIAAPAGYYIMHRWLQNFAYHTELHWWVFILAAILTISIALFTVSIKSVRAAMTKPAKNLKTE